MHSRGLRAVHPEHWGDNSYHIGNSGDDAHEFDLPPTLIVSHRTLPSRTVIHSFENGNPYSSQIEYPRLAFRFGTPWGRITTKIRYCERWHLVSSHDSPRV